jgi:hypothetical protein
MYELKEVTMRVSTGTADSKKIAQLWDDIMTFGKYPLSWLEFGYDSNRRLPKDGLVPVAKYDNYEYATLTRCDLTVTAITEEFLQEFKHRDDFLVIRGKGANMEQAAASAWGQAWIPNMVEQRAFKEDYEVTDMSDFESGGGVTVTLFLSKK